MKVWENLKEYENGILINNNVSIDKEFYLHDQMVKAINDLIGLRKNRAMTEHYFRTALTTDERRESHNRRLHEANGAYKVEYVGYPTEWRIPDNIGRNALNFIIKDDNISFGYLYQLLVSEKLGREFEGYSDDAIMYAIDFDIDEVQKEMDKIADPVKAMKYLISMRLKSKLVLNEIGDQILDNLKNSFETQIDLLIENENFLSEHLAKFDGISICYEDPSPQINAITKNEYQFSLASFLDRLTPIFNNSYILQEGKLDFYKYDIAVNVLKNEFEKYIHSGNISGRVKTQELLDFVDRWIIQIKNAIDQTLYRSPNCSYFVPTEVNGTMVDLEYSFDNITFARLLVQEAMVIAARYKATILFNNRDTDEILYAAWKGGCQFVLDERERLSKSFGEIAKLKEVKDVDTNINIFYKRLLTYTEFALQESIVYKDTEENEAACASTYKQLERHLRKWFKEFKSLVSYHNDICPEPQFEIRQWLEVTQFCLASFFTEFEKYMLSNIELSQLCNVNAIQLLHFEGLYPLIEKMVDETISRTDDEAYNDFVNDLKTVDANRLEHTIPEFQRNSITKKMMTFSKWCNTLGLDPNDEELETIIQKASNDSFELLRKYVREHYKSTAPEKLHEDKITQKNSTETAETSSVKTYYPKPLGNQKINVHVIYEHIKNSLEVRSRKRNADSFDLQLTEQDFETAIFTADFSKLQENGRFHQAIEYPCVIIYHLKDLFYEDWYKAACASLGKNASTLNSFHRSGITGKIDNDFPTNLTI